MQAGKRCQGSRLVSRKPAGRLESLRPQGAGSGNSRGSLARTHRPWALSPAVGCSAALDGLADCM